MNKVKLKVRRDVYEVAQRLLAAAGPLPVMATVEATQKADEFQHQGDTEGWELWSGVAAFCTALSGQPDAEIKIWESS